MSYLHDTDRDDLTLLGEQAAEAIRTLNHLTRGAGAFADRSRPAS